MLARMRLAAGEWLIRFAVIRVMPTGPERSAWKAATVYGSRWCSSAKLKT